MAEIYINPQTEQLLVNLNWKHQIQVMLKNSLHSQQKHILSNNDEKKNKLKTVTKAAIRNVKVDMYLNCLNETIPEKDNMLINTTL